MPPAPDNKKNTFHEYIIDTRRVVKVTQGGRIFSFSIFALVCSQDGQFGFGSGKASDGLSARKKAIEKAKKNIRKIHTRGGRTIPHTVEASYGSTKIFIRPAPAGTGLVAGSSVRTLLEGIGIKDAVAKIHGPNNKHASLLCAANALSKLKSLKLMASIRSKKIKDIIPPKIDEIDEEKVN